jgi:hypothetical protein
MSQYLVLIYGREAEYDRLTDERLDVIMEGHAAFGAKYADSIVAGNALQPPSTATTVRDGAITDGPFVETKEALGGYYLVEAPDLDAVLAMVKEIPTVGGGVEVRPIRVFG